MSNSLDGKESASNAGDPGLIPTPAFCLGNSVDRRAWWATVHGVTELDTTK